MCLGVVFTHMLSEKHLQKLEMTSMKGPRGVRSMCVRMSSNNHHNKLKCAPYDAKCTNHFEDTSMMMSMHISLGSDMYCNAVSWIS